MDKIDKFIYINLDKREDRKKHILSELKKFNIPDEKIIRFSAVEHLKGQIGCGFSHIGVMEMFKESGDKIWCILEDDNVFTKNLEETNVYINEFLSNSSYDVFLGCTASLKAKNIRGSEKLIRAIKSKMTSFYIMRSNVTDAMIASHKQSIRSYGQNFYKKGIPIDVMWFNLMKIFVFVTSYFNPLGSQLVGYSDIMHKNKDYNKITKTERYKLQEESESIDSEKDTEVESL
jgi:GR25 family glycosyltransferase involved in LPS biosynthesis